MSNAEIGKLRWRCRRGMKELDLLLTRYVDEQYRDATPELQEAFRQLLESQDPLIHAYLVGSELPADPLLSALIRDVRRFAPK